MKPENPNIKMAYERKMTLGFTGVAEFSTNPFQNHISIRSPQKDQMVLKSAKGKVIGNYEIEKGQSRVNTANFSSGMYILTFINQNRSFKLIKL
ncbi:T9SS type A sorting domain-containing protein [Brumimicrobium aurantiacum]|uniref:T9SS C-terminal target domain-containing protein n=1 Tax=Brumimicrobium aurantiacum TaxID=1737063 RepID=A0A3E1EWY2_9FLAO|nr:T9SS type A sorting domain-containing protein [Brumimicrobium aurantiacum]RFC54066.1 T9SS C-terminal target domain-containing protein [Brumimicrobium aurantiacum]